MKIYWSPKNIPELAGLDAATQKNLMRQAVQEGRQRLGTQFIVTRVLMIGLGGMLLLMLLSNVLQGFIGGAVAGGLIGLAIALFLQTPCIDAGREWLREQGQPKP